MSGITAEKRNRLLRASADTIERCAQMRRKLEVLPMSTLLFLFSHLVSAGGLEPLDPMIKSYVQGSYCVLHSLAKAEIIKLFTC